LWHVDGSHGADGWPCPSPPWRFDLTGFESPNFAHLLGL
jgi:hypothetical protein